MTNELRSYFSKIFFGAVELATRTMSGYCEVVEERHKVDPEMAISVLTSARDHLDEAINAARCHQRVSEAERMVIAEEAGNSDEEE